MNCSCGAQNPDHEHRCTRCGRRLYLPGRRAIASHLTQKSALAHAYESEPSAAPSRAVPEPDVPVQARQSSLFTPSREDLKVVPMRPSAASRRGALARTTPSPRDTRGSAQQQQRLSLSFPQELRPHETFIYCDAPVALPTHRALAAAADASMILLCVGIFLVIFHFAGVDPALNRTTLPYFAAGLFLLTNFYRLLWCLAGGDTAGMRWSGLELTNFDGKAPDRSQRIYRLLASHVSLIAAGLGLLWALVDEEKLTWHDHISKTFPTPRKGSVHYRG